MNVDNLNSYEDLTIIGTPAMIFFEDNEATLYEVGYDITNQTGPDIVTLMRTVVNEWIDKNLIKPRDILVYW